MTDRESLRSLADLYFEALAARNPSLLPLTPGCEFTENNTLLELGEGHWRAGGKESYRMQIFDPEQGGIGIEAVIPSYSGPASMALRLKAEDDLISEIEAVVTYKGATPIFAPGHLSGTAPSEFWTRTIRPAERNGRYELIAAAELYWRSAQTMGTPEYVRAPALPDTNRTENGLLMTNSFIPVSALPDSLLPPDFLPPPDGRILTGTLIEQGDRGIIKGMKVTERRYPLVDEEVGAWSVSTAWSQRERLWVSSSR